MAETIFLPDRGVPPKPDDDDPVDYYYKPLTAQLYRARLRLAASLLGAGPYESLIEIGYGSGIFLPELARRTQRLAAIDIHAQVEPVRQMLTTLGVDADLRQASLYELPYTDSAFDALICLSVLEHLTDLTGALDEFRRVMRPGSVAVLGYPVRNPVTDAFFRLVGYNPREIHPSSHADILRAAEAHRGFAVEQRGTVPAFLPTPVAAYAACRCIAR